MTRGEYAALAILGTGIVLLAASALWPVVKDPRTEWTEADAQRRAEAGMTVHRLAHEMGQRPEGPQQEQLAGELKAASQKYETVDRELGDARVRFGRTARWLRWTGYGALALGIAVYFAVRRRAA